jgi:hypothetical protein
MKHIKKLDINFNDWGDLNFDINLHYIKYKWENVYLLCVVLNKNYGGLSKSLFIWDISNKNKRLSCYTDYHIGKHIIELNPKIDSDYYYIINNINQSKLDYLLNNNQLNRFWDPIDNF